MLFASRWLVYIFEKSKCRLQCLPAQIPYMKHGRPTPLIREIFPRSRFLQISEIVINLCFSYLLISDIFVNQTLSGCLRQTEIRVRSPCAYGARWRAGRTKEDGHRQSIGDAGNVIHITKARGKLGGTKTGTELRKNHNSPLFTVFGS